MKRILFFILLVLILGGLWFGYEKYQQIFAPNVNAQLGNDILLIQPESKFEDVVSSLENGYIKDVQGFRWVASQMNYNNSSI